MLSLPPISFLDSSNFQRLKYLHTSALLLSNAVNLHIDCATALRDIIIPSQLLAVSAVSVVPKVGETACWGGSTESSEIWGVE